MGISDNQTKAAEETDINVGSSGSDAERKKTTLNNYLL